MSDAFLVPLRASEHSRDFHKPVTVQALSRFDPDLNLIRNHRTGSFEVHRKTSRLRRLWLGADDGYLSFKEDMLIYVCDWDEGLVGSDDPTSLLASLEAGDTVRHPELADDDRVYREIVRQRTKLSEDAAQLHRYALADNRRQMLRAFTPMHDLTPLVR